MKGRMLGAVLLVAGVAIGAGMLGMPVMTGFAGFYPSLIVMFLSWTFLLMTAFAMVDINLSMEGKSNMISMAQKTLGSGGKVFSWVVYLFLLYALDVAFLAAGGKILSDLFPSIPAQIFPFLIAALLGLVIQAGMRTLDQVNRLLVIGKLLIGYGIVVFFVPQHVRVSLLSHHDWAILPFTLPVVVQAFGFHTVVPSIVHYLHKDRTQIRRALTLGSLIAFIVYVVWECLVLGVVPVTGVASIANTYIQGDVSTTPLIHILKTPLIATGAIIFAICGVSSAFLGVTLGLSDCLKDGLKQSLKKNWLIALLTFFPPLLFVYTSPSIFLEALNYAGALVAIIFGILPLCMAWKTKKSGKALYFVGICFFCFVILYDIFSKMGYLTRLLHPYVE